MWTSGRRCGKSARYRRNGQHERAGGGWDERDGDGYAERDGAVDEPEPDRFDAAPELAGADPPLLALPPEPLLPERGLLEAEPLEPADAWDVPPPRLPLSDLPPSALADFLSELSDPDVLDESEPEALPSPPLPSPLVPSPLVPSPPLPSALLPETRLSLR